MMAILVLLRIVSQSHKVLKTQLNTWKMWHIRDFAEQGFSLKAFQRMRGHMSKPIWELTEETIWEGLACRWVLQKPCTRPTKAFEFWSQGNQSRWGLCCISECHLLDISPVKLQVVFKSVFSPAYPHQQPLLSMGRERAFSDYTLLIMIN